MRQEDALSSKNYGLLKHPCTVLVASTLLLQICHQWHRLLLSGAFQHLLIAAPRFPLPLQGNVAPLSTRPANERRKRKQLQWSGLGVWTLPSSADCALAIPEAESLAGHVASFYLPGKLSGGLETPWVRPTRPAWLTAARWDEESFWFSPVHEQVAEVH